MPEPSDRSDPPCPLTTSGAAERDLPAVRGASAGRRRSARSNTLVAADDAVRDGWRRLHDAHALVLDDDGTSSPDGQPLLRSPDGVPGAGGRSGEWFANCAWDAFGICAALHVDGRIDTICADCGDPLTGRGARRSPSSETLVFHCLVRASRRGSEIVFT